MSDSYELRSENTSYEKLPPNSCEVRCSGSNANSLLLEKKEYSDEERVDSLFCRKNLLRQSLKSNFLPEQLRKNVTFTANVVGGAVGVYDLRGIPDAPKTSSVALQLADIAIHLKNQQYQNVLADEIRVTSDSFKKDETKKKKRLYRNRPYYRRKIFSNSLFRRNKHKFNKLHTKLPLKLSYYNNLLSAASPPPVNACVKQLRSLKFFLRHYQNEPDTPPLMTLQPNIMLQLNKLTFMTFNAGLLQYRLGGITWYRNPAFTERRLYQISPALKNSQCDCIALQEVYEDWQADFLVESLRVTYPFVARRTSGGSFSLHNGLMILSKFPILKTAFHAFGAVTIIEKVFCSKGILEATLEIPTVGRVTFVNIHLASGAMDPESLVLEALRNEELEQVLALSESIASRNEIPIIIGDLNAAPNLCSSNYSKLRELGWTDAFLAAMLKQNHLNAGTASLKNKTTCLLKKLNFRCSRRKLRPEKLLFWKKQVLRNDYLKNKIRSDEKKNDFSMTSASSKQNYLRKNNYSTPKSPDTDYLNEKSFTEPNQTSYSLESLNDQDYSKIFLQQSNQNAKATEAQAKNNFELNNKVSNESLLTVSEQERLGHKLPLELFLADKPTVFLNDQSRELKTHEPQELTPYSLLIKDKNLLEAFKSLPPHNLNLGVCLNESFLELADSKSAAVCKYPETVATLVKNATQTLLRIHEDNYNYMQMSSAEDQDLFCTTYFTWDPKNPLNAIGPHAECHGSRCDHLFLPPKHIAGKLNEFVPAQASVCFKEPQVTVEGCCCGLLGEASLVTLSDHYAVKVELERRYL